MNGILMGTTPDFIINIKPEDFAVSDVTKLELTIWHGTSTTYYHLDDVTVDTEANAFGIRFTESDTLALGVSKSFRWQLRCMFADGTIVGTEASEPVSIKPLKSTEVMSA